jgi:hypothetical protein
MLGSLFSIWQTLIRFGNRYGDYTIEFEFIPYSPKSHSIPRQCMLKLLARSEGEKLSRGPRTDFCQKIRKKLSATSIGNCNYSIISSKTQRSRLTLTLDAASRLVIRAGGYFSCSLFEINLCSLRLTSMAYPDIVPPQSIMC